MKNSESLNPDLNPFIAKFFDTVYNWGTQQFIKDGKLELAHCFMYAGGKIVHIPIPMINKNGVSAFLSIAAKTIKPTALTFVSECWMVVKKMDDDRPLNEIKKEFRGINVSEQPDKTECLMFVNETKLVSNTVAVNIIRDKDGIPKLGDSKSSTGGEGRFVNLLCDPVNEN